VSVSAWIPEEAFRSRTSPEDGFLVAKRSGVVVIGGIRFPIRAGETLWAPDFPELGYPEFAALFGIRPRAAVAAESAARRGCRRRR
jgi:hypothetical protein